MDESKAVKDLNSRIKQLTKLILTSQTVEEVSRPGSPVKIDFDVSPYEVRSRLTSSLSNNQPSSANVVATLPSFNKNSSLLVARSSFKASRSSLSKTSSGIDRCSLLMSLARKIDWSWSREGGS